ncbi:MAG: hypothetical protein IJ745_05400 [Bacteroidales bacterium]|nr:hypothetical protein [Bacteroidales bacterium]
MKKLTAILISTLAVAATAMGQEKKWQPEYSVGLGVATLFDYPALSVQADDTRSYTGTTATFGFGMRHVSGAYYGLRYDHSAFNTAFVANDEQATIHNIALDVRFSTMLTANLELQMSATLGLAILHNQLASGGTDYSFNRFGMSSRLELGMRYYASDDLFFFFNVGLGNVAGFSNSLNLPTGMEQQHRNVISTGHATGGIGFGFRPKQKKLNMDAELVNHSQPLELACYAR